MALVSAVDLSAAVTAPTGDADLVARLAAAADRAVRRYLGREFAAGPFTELHPGGGQLLFLRHYPVAAVTSLAVDAAGEFPAGSVRPAASYVVHPDRGVVENRDGPFGPRLPGAVRVVYAAVADVPADVKQATLLLAEHWYREAKTHAATGQMNVGTAADGTAYPWGQAAGYKLPPAVLQLLRLGREPTV